MVKTIDLLSKVLYRHKTNSKYFEWTAPKQQIIIDISLNSGVSLSEIRVSARVGNR